jgi:hypothetical protein
MALEHLRAFNIELTNDFRNNCRTITIFDNRHLHRVELTTWDWNLSLRGIADRWFKLRDIEIESFTYLRDEHLVYLTKDFLNPIHGDSLGSPTLAQIVIDTPNESGVEIVSQKEPSHLYRLDCIYKDDYIKDRQNKIDEWF